MILLISLCENTRLFGKMPAMLPQHRQKRSVTVVRKNMGSSHRHRIQIAYCQLPCRSRQISCTLYLRMCSQHWSTF